MSSNVILIGDKRWRFTYTQNRHHALEQLSPRLSSLSHIHSHTHTHDVLIAHFLSCLSIPLSTVFSTVDWTNQTETYANDTRPVYDFTLHDQHVFEISSLSALKSFVFPFLAPLAHFVYSNSEASDLLVA